VNDEPVKLPSLAGALAAAMVEAQYALDEAGRASILAWEQDGIPPAALAWSECRLRLPLALGCLGRTGAGDTTTLMAASRPTSGQDSMTLVIRYLPAPLDEDEAQDEAQA
jgi:hypothetical protein